MFLITTPDALFQPRVLVDDIKYINHRYHTTQGVYQGTRPYDVHSHASFLGLLLKYIAVALPSHYPVLSYIVITLALVGVYTLAQQDIKFASTISVTFVSLVIYFSTFRVFIVRNFLILLPFVALFAGAGLAFVIRLASNRVLRTLLLSGAASILVINAAWLFNAAESIVHQGRSYDVHVASAYIQAHPGQAFALSATVFAAFRKYHVRVPSDVTGPKRANQFMFFDSDTETDNVHLRRWPSVEPNTYVTLGPEEVNFNYYSTWVGADRIIVLSKATATAFGLSAKVLHLVSVNPGCNGNQATCRP